MVYGHAEIRKYFNIYPLYEKKLNISNHKLNYVTDLYSDIPEINVSTKDQQRYIKCTRKEILNFSTGLSIDSAHAKRILEDFEIGHIGHDDVGGIENIRYLVLLLVTGSADQKGVSK